ncbi:glycosyl transferase, partial [Chytriomyces sp. MP71]
LLFVTVGTTRFDALVAAVTNPEFVESLRGLGFTHVTIQHGSSPVNLLSISDINVELFDYAPSIASYLERADAVITHAGAGSLLESIRNGCKAIAVPNASLMHNHQNELAQKLASEGLCVCAEPDT